MIHDVESICLIEKELKRMTMTSFIYNKLNFKLAFDIVHSEFPKLMFLKIF